METITTPSPVTILNTGDMTIMCFINGFNAVTDPSGLFSPRYIDVRVKHSSVISGGTQLTFTTDLDKGDKLVNWLDFTFIMINNTKLS